MYASMYKTFNPSFWSTHPGPIAFQEVPQAPLYAQCAEERTKGQWKQIGWSGKTNNKVVLAWFGTPKEDSCESELKSNQERLVYRWFCFYWTNQFKEGTNANFLGISV